MPVIARQQDHGDYRGGKELETTTIVVAEIIPPEGKALSGKIKSTDNRTFWAFPTLLKRAEQFGDQPMTIDYIEKPTKYGNLLKEIDKIHGAAAQPARAQAASQRQQPQPSASVVREIDNTPRQKATSYNNNPGAAVMGMVNQYVSRGDVPLNEDAIAEAINVCVAGYLKSKLGQAA